MAEPQIPGSCGDKGKQVYVHEGNRGHQTQGDSAADSWLVQVKEGCNPQNKMRQLSTNVCIYRVPKVIMDSNPQSYLPLVVSLGPYHHKVNPKLSAMDKHKFEAVHRTLRRLKGVTLDDLIAEIKRIENEIRDFYEDSAIECNGETLTWMFLMDSCFILEIIRCLSETETTDINSFSLVFCIGKRSNQLHFTIVNGILKLENQIPMFLLINILQLEFGTREDAVSKLATTLTSFREFGGYPFSTQSSDDEVLKEHIQNGACHLLDLSRRMIKNILIGSNLESTCPTNNVDGHSSWSTPRAELLQKAGIKFKSGKVRFQKRRFGGSTLSLPQIFVDGSTETRLRNLMVFEECQSSSCSPKERVISHYMCFMDDMVDSEKDVSILRKSLVMESFLGSDEEIAYMFNHLGKGITISSLQQFEIVGKQARENYNSLLKVWVNQFKVEHCSKPWYIVSL